MKDFASCTPFEISGEVFLAGLESFGPNYWENDRTSAALLQYLLTITSVSSLWRKIALRTPPLWTKIVLGRRKPVYDRPWGTIWHMQRVSAQLSRSCQASLEVTVHAFASRAHEPSKGPVWVWLSTAEKHLSRCRIIRFLEIRLGTLGIFPLPRLLERCQLLHIDFDLPECSKGAKLTPITAPHMHTFVGTNIEPLLLVSFPFEQLARVTLDVALWRSWMYPSLLHALSKCLSLVELGLLGAADDVTHDLTPVTCTALRSLRIGGPKLLSLIQAPQLRRLECSYEAILKAGALSAPLLEHLVLHEHWGLWNGAFKWSQSHPTIQIVEIRGWDSHQPAEVFDHFVLGFSNEDRFPALRILRLWPDLRYAPHYILPVIPIPLEDVTKLAFIMQQRPRMSLQYHPSAVRPSDVQYAANQLPLRRIQECRSIIPPDVGE